MNFLKLCYLREWALFRRSLLIFIVIFFLLNAACYIGYSSYYYKAAHLKDKTADRTVAEITDEVKKTVDFVNTFRRFPFIGLFLNNFRICTAIILVGAIPFLFLTIPTILFSGFRHGIAFASLIHGFDDSLYFFSLFTVPHGFLEFVAILYSGSIGVNLTTAITKKVLPKHRKGSPPLLQIGINATRSCFLIVIPLLAVAAIVETYLTTRIVDIMPKGEKVTYLLANAHYNNGRYDRAISNYTKVLNLNPNHAEAYSRRGSAYFYKHQYDQALSDFTKTLQLDPNDAVTYCCRANVYEEKEQYEQAILDNNKAIAIDPNKADPYHNLGWILATAKDPGFRDGKRAVEYGLKACELSNWKRPVCLDMLAAAYARVGDFDNAIKWEQRAIELKKSGGAQKRLKLYQEHKPWPPD